jgi:hypothetical protein
MSAAARIVLAVLLVALVGLGGAYWWVTRPTPEEVLVGETRVLIVDPTVELPYLLEIPTAANGCPGYTVPAPGESIYDPIVGPDEFRSEWAITLDGDAAILAVCFGPVSELGELDDFVGEVLDSVGEHLDEDSEDPVVAALVREQVGAVDEIRSPHGDGPAVTTKVGSSVLTDFYVEHDGFIHGVGYLRPESTGDLYLPTVEAMLASWSWD